MVGGDEFSVLVGKLELFFLECLLVQSVLLFA